MSSIVRPTATLLPPTVPRAEHPGVEVWERVRRVERVDADTTAGSDGSWVKELAPVTEPQKSVWIGPSEKAERACPDTKAGAELAARAVSHEVVGEGLLSLAQG
jgi:hypothetical protein